MPAYSGRTRRFAPTAFLIENLSEWQATDPVASKAFRVFNCAWQAAVTDYNLR